MTDDWWTWVVVVVEVVVVVVAVSVAAAVPLGRHLHRLGHRRGDPVTDGCPDWCLSEHGAPPPPGGRG